MNYTKKSKPELLQIILKLETEKKQALEGLCKLQNEHNSVLDRHYLKNDELDNKLDEIKESLRESEKERALWQNRNCDTATQLDELNILFCMLVHSLLNLQNSDEKNNLTRKQESIICVSDSLREGIIKKAS